MADASHSPFAPPPQGPPEGKSKKWLVIFLVGFVVIAVALSLFALSRAR